MPLKTSMPRVQDTYTWIVHLEAPPALSAISLTLCGKTEWLNGSKPSGKTVSCTRCRAIADHCQTHRKLSPLREVQP